MRRRAHRYHRPPQLHVVDHMPHLFVRQVAEAGEDDHQVRRVQRFETWDIVAPVRVDRAILRIDREQHGTSESVAGSQDLGQLR